MTERIHAPYSPSSSATWILCSFSARNAVPDPPKPKSTKEAADEGTRVHDLFEDFVKNDKAPDEDDSAAEAVERGVRFVRKLEPGELHTELQVQLSDECWGYVDLFNDAPYIVTVLDLKYGRWDVDAMHNMQLLSYCVMLLSMTNAEWFRLVIYQPRGLDEKPFKQWVAHRTQVEAHKVRMLQAIADRSPPKPGPHCRWCKAFQVCPVMNDDAAFLRAAMTRRIEDLSTHDLVRMLRLIRAFGDVKKAYEEALTVKLKLGQPAPDGAGLEASRSWRAWNDPVQAAMHLHSHYGFKGVKPPTPAQAEKLGPAGKQYAAVAAHQPPGELKARY
jgi:CRISPR/Cas system-associated exonuclease Cas4 (RecB family)